MKCVAKQFTISIIICAYIIAFPGIGVGEDDSLMTIDAHLDTIDSQKVIDLSEGVKEVAFLDENTLISGGIDGHIRFWDIQSGRQVQDFFLSSYSALTRWGGAYGGRISIALSSDKSTLALVVKGTKIVLWDVVGRKTIKSFSAYGRYPTISAFSAKENVFAYDSYKNDYLLILNRLGMGKAGVNIISSIDAKPIGKFLEHNYTVGSLSFSPNGKLLAVGLLNEYVYIWDWKTGHRLKIIKAHNRKSTYFPSINVAFSPDSSILVTSGTDHTVKLWDTNSWAKIQTIHLIPKNESVNQGNIDDIASFAFSPNGSLLAGGSAYRGKIYIWDINSREVIHCFEGHKKGKDITSLNFSSDGHLLASGSDDGTIKIWRLFVERKK